MSKEIDLQNLKAEDVEYLQQRPWLIDEAARIGADVPKLEDAPPPPEHNVVQLSLKDGQALPYQDSPAITPSAEEPPLDSEDGDAYTEWKVSELQEEIKSRNEDLEEGEKMSLSGTKAELIARLEEDDARE